MAILEWYVELRFNGHRTWLPGWTEGRVVYAIDADDAKDRALATCIPCAGVYVSKLCTTGNMLVDGHVVKEKH